MLNKEDWMYITTQRGKGVYIKDIAAELGVSTKTVSRALERGGAPTGKRPGVRKSILDPYKVKIDGLLREGGVERGGNISGDSGSGVSGRGQHPAEIYQAEAGVASGS